MANELDFFRENTGSPYLYAYEIYNEGKAICSAWFDTIKEMYCDFGKHFSDSDKISYGHRLPPRSSYGLQTCHYTEWCRLFDNCYARILKMKMAVTVGYLVLGNRIDEIGISVSSVFDTPEQAINEMNEICRKQVNELQDAGKRIVDVRIGPQSYEIKLEDGAVVFGSVKVMERVC